MAMRIVTVTIFVAQVVLSIALFVDFTTFRAVFDSKCSSTAGVGATIHACVSLSKMKWKDRIIDPAVASASCWFKLSCGY